MKHLPIILQHLVVILIGYIFFVIDDKELIQSTITADILLVLVFAKVLYFVIHSLKKIKELTLKDETYTGFIMLIGINISLIVISFALDYFCFYQLDDHSFVGIVATDPTWKKIIDFIYFSISTFATTGFGDINAVTVLARITVMLEISISFVTTVFVISNFIMIQEVLRENRWNKIP